jgi:hypothetical protein
MNMSDFSSPDWNAMMLPMEEPFPPVDQLVKEVPCQICARTGLSPATSALGLGSPLPHLHQDRTRSH